MEIKFAEIESKELVKGIIGLPSAVVGSDSFLANILPPITRTPLKMAFALTPNAVVNKAISIVNRDSGIVALKLKSALRKSGIDIDIGRVALITDKEKEYITGISVEIKRINYSQLVERFLPDILRYFTTEDESLLSKVINILADEQEKIAKAILDNLSEEKKEELGRLILSERQAEICGVITKFAQEGEVYIEVKDIII